MYSCGSLNEAQTNRAAAHVCFWSLDGRCCGVTQQQAQQQERAMLCGLRMKIYVLLQLLQAERGQNGVLLLCVLQKQSHIVAAPVAVDCCLF